MSGNISKKVKLLKEKWGTSDPFRLCSYLKIIILYKDLGGIKGYYKKILNRKVIILNQNLSFYDKKVVCAHELGHCILHSTNDVKLMLEHGRLAKKSRYENEANEFAEKLLLDENDTNEYTSKIKYFLYE